MRIFLHVAKLAVILMVCIHHVPTVHGETPYPSFPVGSIIVHPTHVSNGSAKLVWSIHLPEGEDDGDFFHVIKQIQHPDHVIMNYDPEGLSGEMFASFPLGTGGSVFELWTIRNSSSDAFLLDSTFVHAYAPTATVIIHSEDPYFFPRTRADRPFSVEIAVDGLQADEDTPESMKSVNLRRYVQSYGESGNGSDIDRSQATLLQQINLTENKTCHLSFPVNSIPGADRSKVRGEERFSVYTVEDYDMPATALNSKFIQIWPVEDAQIAGLTDGQIIGPEVPPLHFHLHDLYPSSTTYAQIYKGSAQLGTLGRIVPGITLVLYESEPVNRTFVVQDYLAMFDSDGVWTMEILTQTPFDIKRLDHVTFTVEGTVSILEDWRDHHFGSRENSGDAADLNDFDHDGLPNLIEFAFGLDPKKADRSSMPVPQMIGDQLGISFTQPVGVGGITYGAEWSSNLQPESWMPITNSNRPPQYTFMAPATDDKAVFMRLKVTGQ